MVVFDGRRRKQGSSKSVRANPAVGFYYDSCRLGDLCKGQTAKAVCYVGSTMIYFYFNAK